MIKTYRELIQIPSFKERLKYLSLNGRVGDLTFGGHRQLNQMLYQSQKWRRLRRDVILRDDGCDLAHQDYPLDKIYIHHLNPISVKDLIEDRPTVFDMDNLVCVSFQTHNAIHYGCTERNEKRGYTERRPNDTCPWLA